MYVKQYKHFHFTILQNMFSSSSQLTTILPAIRWALRKEAVCYLSSTSKSREENVSNTRQQSFKEQLKNGPQFEDFVLGVSPESYNSQDYKIDSTFKLKREHGDTERFVFASYTF